MQDYTAVLDENERLRAELSHERKTIEDFRRMEQSMRESIALAQKTAEDVTTQAKRSADLMIETAAKEAQNLRREGALQAKAQLDDAADKVRAVVAEYERLVREKHQFLRRMKGNVQEELALINDAIATMPDMVAEQNAKDTAEQEGV